MHTRITGFQTSCCDPKLGQRTALSPLSHRSRSAATQHAINQCRPLKAQLLPSETNQAEVEYKDTWSDVQFINMCRRAYGNLADWQSQRDWNDGEETYKGMLEVSRALMKVTLPMANMYQTAAAYY